jgi:hypothetical protein
MAMQHYYCIYEQRADAITVRLTPVCVFLCVYFCCTLQYKDVTMPAHLAMPPSTEELLQSTDTLVVLASVSTTTTSILQLLSVLPLPVAYNCVRACSRCHFCSIRDSLVIICRC